MKSRMQMCQINQPLTSIMKGLLVNLSNAKVVIYFSSVMSLVLVNITEISQILTALAVITVETFYISTSFRCFSLVLLQNSFIANIVAILIMQQG